jgi:hypothetical protein
MMATATSKRPATKRLRVKESKSVYFVMKDGEIAFVGKHMGQVLDKASELKGAFCSLMCGGIEALGPNAPKMARPPKVWPTKKWQRSAAASHA